MTRVERTPRAPESRAERGPLALLEELAASLGAPDEVAECAALAAAAVLPATSAVACLVGVARASGGAALYSASTGDARGRPMGVAAELSLDGARSSALFGLPTTGLRWAEPAGPDGSIACVLLQAGGAALGTLSLAFAADVRPDGALVAAAARECGRALDRARLAEVGKAAGARLDLLAEAGALVAGAPEKAETLSELTALAVPRLCDFAALDLLENGALRRLAAAHRDPGKSWLLRELGRTRVPSETPAEPAAQVALEGRPALYPELPEPALEAMASSDHEAALLRELAPTSALSVPIVVKGVLCGVLSLGMADSGRALQAADLPVAEELARRAAWVLERAQLRGEADRESGDRRRAEADRERLRFELKEAIQVRDSFLSIASHELKTPLTALQLAIQSAARTVATLDQSPERDLCEKRLSVGEKQIKRLNALVDQLLDISRIQLGRLELHPEELDLCALIRELAERTAGEFQSAGTELTIRLPPSLVGCWDGDRIDQVLSNLLSNALKYGAGKPVLLEVQALPGLARITVRDQGIGIAPEHQQRIFERFERAVSSRHYSGFGLGLWIVRRILDALAGSIRVQSEPGRGSVFVVDLPLPPARARGAA